jgi:outer membrane lipoprotein carrier protein
MVPVLWIFLALFNLGSETILVRKFEALYRSARTLEATFLEQYSENGRVVRTEAGIAYFRRPGKMRWEYKSPESDVYLVDGKTAWFYVPADHTVTREPAGQSSDWRAPLALLAGNMEVSRMCARVELAQGERPVTPGDAVLQCTLRGAEASHAQNSKNHNTSPQTEDAGQSVFFEIVPETGELARILIRGSGRVQVEFRFTHWRINEPLAASLFRFATPPGVVIVDGLLPDAPGLRQ